ncbi:MAG: tRNA (adenosine(37)-N6)-threonylcarbamoyltransferase complex transferase subunit TsaD [Holosporales bacterium]|jgi:N6-L-threonylcarbamoyladenine synthase|nr:tRNA (adenosine(37)-N6)-threonylcarbamoyltransferase complex transferase subunit TsaD [Holosporales bacterium]
MEKDELILGIETSCDETSAAVVSFQGNGIERLKSNVIYSQICEHLEYGGVVPEIAARAHANTLFPVIEQALSKAGVSIDDISAIAATCGPGLIGGLLVGSLAAKTIALIKQKPFIAINHLAAHAQVCRFVYDSIEFPFLLLLISGGHCQFLEVYGIKQYKLLGETLDDSAGEVFDKIARLLQVSGGGATIEKMAVNGDSKRFSFSIPLKDRNDCDMSFSGLKTAFRVLIEKMAPLSMQDKNDFAACLQKGIANALIDKARRALGMTCEEVKKKRTFVVSGGVAANQTIRKAFQELCDCSNFQLFCPPIHLCTDNAAMVAWLGLEQYKAGFINDISFTPKPRWALEKL